MKAGGDIHRRSLFACAIVFAIFCFGLIALIGISIVRGETIVLGGRWQRATSVRAVNDALRFWIWIGIYSIGVVVSAAAALGVWREMNSESLDKHTR